MNFRTDVKKKASLSTDPVQLFTDILTYVNPDSVRWVKIMKDKFGSSYYPCIKFLKFTEFASPAFPRIVTDEDRIPATVNTTIHKCVVVQLPIANKQWSSAILTSAVKFCEEYPNSWITRAPEGCIAIVVDHVKF